jgi:hypothetical protein
MPTTTNMLTNPADARPVNRPSPIFTGPPTIRKRPTWTVGRDANFIEVLFHPLVVHIAVQSAKRAACASDTSHICSIYLGQKGDMSAGSTGR